jgi:Peptide-N-glycosidase F, C terminal
MPSPACPRLSRIACGLALLALPLASCSSGDNPSGATGSATTGAPDAGPPDAGTGGDGGAGGMGGSGGADSGPPMTYPPCQGPTPMGAAFSTAMGGIAPRDLAADFTVPTIDGDWSFSKSWTGCDSYVFVNYATGYPYATGLWGSSTDKLLKNSPPNVHYFFMSFAMDDPTVLADVTKMKVKVDKSIAKLPSDQQASWNGRFHYVTKGARSMNNWISDMLKAQGAFAFGIDRFQRIRQIGLLLSPLTQTMAGELDYVTHEAQYYNFEWDREQALAAEKSPTVIDVLKQETMNYDVDVTLPDAATMAGFDTMEIDLSFYCAGHDDKNCGAWDYIANLFLCDVADPSKCPTELARWITTYGREGRWVTDVSPMLALLKDGGKRRFHLNPANSYVVDMSFRLYNQGKGSHPTDAQYLFSGGSFNAMYNDGYMPVSFMVPADVKKVEIAALITGHGWGVEAANCAEFCNTDHHFTVNGSDHVKDHPEAGTPDGCMKQIPTGSVPDQYGTWPLGRDGWCPGLDVKPWVIDVTKDVMIGGMNTVTYKGLYKGMTYTPMPGDPNSGGFGANINMASWLIFSR